MNKRGGGARVKKPAKRKPKKPRRVVLGIGEAWIGANSVCLRDRWGRFIPPKGIHLADGRRVRLVAEVLK